MRIYIAGPMTIYKNKDWGAAAFAAATSKLRSQGHTAVSPVELDIALWGFDSRKQHKLPKIMTRRRVLAFDIGVVIPTCDAIFMLRNWSKSSGARAELAAAITYGLKVIWEPGAESPKSISIWPKGLKLDGSKATKKRSGGSAVSKRRRQRRSTRSNDGGRTRPRNGKG